MVYEKMNSELEDQLTSKLLQLEMNGCVIII